MIGSRTRGTRGGTFLFAARTWDGVLPDGIDTVIRSESNIIKVMGRIMTTGGDDLEAARALQDQWRLETLSQHLGTPTPPRVLRTFPDPATTSWLERVAFSLADGSMATADAEWLDRYAEIGLEPGRTVFTAEQLEAAARGEELGTQHLQELAPTLTNAGDLLGTREELQHGARDLFAAGTFLGQWGLPPVESVYVKIDTGSDGLILNGSGGKEYRARFVAPEVSEFWSFTAYAYGNRLMAHNALNRHSRGDRTLTPDADGRYTILLSSDVDAHAADDDFLPIPEEDTYLVLRLYGPSEAMQRGEYPTPVFEVVATP